MKMEKDKVKYIGPSTINDIGLVHGRIYDVIHHDDEEESSWIHLGNGRTIEVADSYLTKRLHPLKVSMENMPKMNIDEAIERMNHQPIELLRPEEESVTFIPLEEMEDLINKPDHYHKGGMDIYDIMTTKFNLDYYRGFCVGNVLKYTVRHEHKEGLKSLEKARFNLNKLIETYEGVKSDGEGETK